MDSQNSPVSDVLKQVKAQPNVKGGLVDYKVPEPSVAVGEPPVMPLRQDKRLNSKDIVSDERHDERKLVTVKKHGERDIKISEKAAKIAEPNFDPSVIENGS